MSNSYYSLVGLCHVSKNLVHGSLLLDAIKNKQVNYVIICEDASDNTKKRIINKCKYYHVDYIIYGDSYSLSNSINKHRVAIGIKESGFVKKFIEIIGG